MCLNITLLIKKATNGGFSWKEKPDEEDTREKGGAEEEEEEEEEEEKEKDESVGCRKEGCSNMEQVGMLS